MAKFLKISLIILLSLCGVAATLILTFFIKRDYLKALEEYRNMPKVMKFLVS